MLRNIAWVANSDTQRKQYEETVKPEHGIDILHKRLQNFHRGHDAEYLLQFQLFENLDDSLLIMLGKSGIHKNIFGKQLLGSAYQARLFQLCFEELLGRSTTS